MLRQETENKIELILIFVSKYPQCKYSINNTELVECGLNIPFLSEAELVNISTNVNLKLGRSFFQLNNPFIINVNPTNMHFIGLHS